MPPSLPRIAASLCAVASLSFWCCYFTLYWPYRHLFNEAGRYFDEREMTVHHAQAGVLIVPALLFLLLAAGFAHAGWTRRRGGRPRPGG